MRTPLAVLALLAVAAGCDSPTGGTPPAPPSPPVPPAEKPPLPTIETGTVVEGTLDASQVLEYELTLPSGDFRLLLLARSGSLADTLVAAIVGADGRTAGSATSTGADTLLAGQASAWVTPDPSTAWRVRVGGLRPGHRGPFQLLLFARNDAPEHRPAAVSIGETVEGTIDVQGDVDEFVLDGAAGEEWIVFAQGLASPESGFVVELVEHAPNLLLARMDAMGGRELEEHSTGRVTLPRAGQYRVRVSGGGFAATTMGRYRLRVDRVNRAPESGTAAVDLGAIVAETIGSVGDIDEFTFTVPAGQEMNLLVQLVDGLSGGLEVELLHDGGTLERVSTSTPAGSLDELGTGRITLPSAGSYQVRVSGRAAGTLASATGSYRFELYPIDRRPEQGGTLRLDGPTVSDAIGRPGDVDEFAFDGAAGQLVVLHVSGAAPPGEVVAALLGPDGRSISSIHVGGAEPRYAQRVQLDASGKYTVRVATNPWSMAKGTYTVGVYTVSSTPEEGSAAISIGETRTGRIDRPGDLDVYTLQGIAGREVAIFLSGEPEFSVSVGPFIHTTAGPASLDGRSTGRLILADAEYRLSVDAHVSATGVAAVGPYALRVFPIDRRPEGRSAAYTVGDTVRGEPLHPAVDIDEYTFELAEPTVLVAHWEASGASPERFVLGRLLREGEAQPVWTTANSGPNARTLSLAQGRYRFSVANPNLVAGNEAAQSEVTRLDYTFAFTP